MNDEINLCSLASITHRIRILHLCSVHSRKYPRAMHYLSKYLMVIKVISHGIRVLRRPALFELS